MTRTITLIQFHSGIDITGGYDDVRKNTVYVVYSMTDSNEFYIGENDDGEDEYDERDCITVHDSLDDFLNERHFSYVASEGLEYSLINIEVEADENDKPIWNNIKEA